jgi:hypothetical protein
MEAHLTIMQQSRARIRPLPSPSNSVSSNFLGTWLISWDGTVPWADPWAEVQKKSHK